MSDGNRDRAVKPDSSETKVSEELASQRLFDLAYVHTGSDSPAHKSYLERAVGSTVETVFSGASDATAAEVTHYAKTSLKMVPLFMRGRGAVLGIGSLYALDEAKIGDGFKDQVIDASLGAAKGFALKGSFEIAMRKGVSPSMAGLQLGAMSRFSESALTRSNYYSQDGFSLSRGLTKSVTDSLKPSHLLVDAAAFSLSDLVAGRLYAVSRGKAFSNPVVTHSITGGTMGFMSGAGYELSRQLETGKMDPLLLARRAAGETIFGTLAGTAGGWQTRMSTRLNISSTYSEHSLARRSSMFQDEAQQSLRLGEFELLGRSGNLTTETWMGRLTLGDGTTKPVIFRPDDGSPAFAARMEAETSSYAMNKGAGLGNSIPVTVERSVTVDGKTRRGYIQEMEGVDLRRYLQDRATLDFGSPTLDNMNKVLRADPPLNKAFGDAMAERMVLGEWDNHSLNLLAVGEKGVPVVKNIDLADSLKPAQTRSDLVPDPGFLKGWEGLNSKLYSDLVGTPISPEFKGSLSEFVTRYDSPAGRLELQKTTGWTAQQAEGVLGRSRWFVEHGVFPAPKQLSVLYPLLGVAKRAVKGTLREGVDAHRLQPQREGGL